MKNKPIKIGDSLPKFALPNQHGEMVSIEQFFGKPFVLYFYPKDDTPGCTKAACSIRDNYRSLSKKGYKAYGVSPDKAKKHQKFIDKYEFQFSLLADTEKKVINDFGLWGPKQFMGKTVYGVYRTTILVDENGTIEHIISKVVTKTHGNQILEVIDAMAEV